jgi:hypothetical protein
MQKVFVPEIDQIISEIKIYKRPVTKTGETIYTIDPLRSIKDRAINLFHFSNEQNWVSFSNKAGALEENYAPDVIKAVKIELIEMLKKLKHEFNSESSYEEEPFSAELLKEVSDGKIQTLCRELNNVFGKNPNAGGMLFRTILLNVLRFKLKNTQVGKKILADSDDLKSVLSKSISNDVYKDSHIKRFLEQFSKIPKDIFDAGVHSDWVLVDQSNLDSQIGGLVKIVEATFKGKNERDD